MLKRTEIYLCKGVFLFYSDEADRFGKKDFPKKLTQLSLQAKPFVDFLNNSLA